MAAPAVKVEVTPAAKAPSVPDPSKKKDILGILILILICVNLGALGALGYFQKIMWIKLINLHERVQRAESNEAAEEEPIVGKELKGREVGVLVPLDSFLVNLPSDQGPKFLQSQIELELPDPALTDEVTRKKPMIRDAIIMLLSSRTFKELRDPAGMAKLRQDLLRSVNNILTSGKVKEIYFTQFHFN